MKRGEIIIFKRDYQYRTSANETYIIAASSLGVISYASYDDALVFALPSRTALNDFTFWAPKYTYTGERLVQTHVKPHYCLRMTIDALLAYVKLAEIGQISPDVLNQLAEISGINRHDLHCLLNKN